VSLTSSVCLIAKNEAPYLVEWIAYYRVLKFDEVIVYENNSDDNSAEILRKLAAAGKVTYRPWTLGRNESPQITAYTDALTRSRTDWMLFVDADEFLVLHNADTVGEFLTPLNARDDVTAVGVNWRIFGDSHMSESDGRPVIERFTLAAAPDFVVNSHLKSFTRVRALRNIVHMHVCETTGTMVHPSGKLLTMPNWGLSETIELDVAQVNHYYTKTLAEYQKKKERGQGGAGENNPELKYWYNDESFVGHNRNDIEDRSAMRRYDRVRAEMDELNALVAA